MPCYHLVPLRQFNRYTAWPDKKDKFPGMEVHDVIPRLIAILLQLLDCFGDVIDCEAYVIEAKLMQVADVRIDDCRRVPIMQELDFRPR